MSENATIRPEADAFQHEEAVKFADGIVAYGSRTPGDRIIFDTKTYNDTSIGCVNIVELHSGKRIAVGERVMVVLPDFNPNAERLPVDEGQELQAKAIEPAGVPDVVIGEDWEFPGDPVSYVMSTDFRGHEQGPVDQRSIPSFFHEAQTLLARANERLLEPYQPHPKANRQG